MDLKLTPVSMPTSVRPNAGVRPSASAGAEGVGGGFSGALKSALGSVSAAQNDATRLQREVQMENPKAQIGFQATLHVRNRMVQAYTDIMNMQV